ncbi:MAG: DNA polymerase III subunit alpha [Candidatus Cyclobacteriaceae bacterium M3_2C_046]
MYLNCHSFYSFKYGTLPIERLVEEAKKVGVDRLALTDINTTSGIFPFVKACQSQQIDPVAGIEFRREGVCDYIGLARNNEGFYQLNKHLTARLRDSKHTVWPDFHHVMIIYPWERLQLPLALKDYEWIGVRPHQVNRLVHSPWLKHLSRMVILQPVTLLDRSQHGLHRVLRAVDNNLIISRLPSELQAFPNEHFVQTDVLLKCYQHFPRIRENTERLLSACSFEHDFANQRERKNRKYVFGSRYEDKVKLEQLAWEGMKRRYGPDNQEAKQRLRKELKIIDDLNFNAYFLITFDIVQYARRRNFFYVGRGSGANSITSYCLRITDVDPIELDLYFERFLNIYRSSPPDFDMDFSWKDRDEVLRYIFDKYGHEHTVLLANFNTFKGRSIIRELGKVFGLPKSEIDQLVAVRGGAPMDEVSRLIFRYGNQIQDFPKHLSIHAGGVLISDREIYHYTATEIPPKNFPISQFDMYIAEDIRFDKFDILSQRGLGHIRTATELIEKNRGIRVDVEPVNQFKKDPVLNLALAKGDTVGCFYIESPAMRQLLLKLHCDTYPLLVAASSIIRPGVASSGMMREYIKNHHEPKQVKYLHPKLAHLLQETYGIMVYQEDVIKVAHHFGGIGMAEADVLRKGMSGKGRSKKKIMEIRDEFFQNCIQRGYPHDIIKEVWRQIESFAGYSFSKAHSASFAVESYQSLFLRCYYPLEFMVAVINNFGGFYSTEFYVHEAKMLGGQIHAPCVNRSEYFTTLYGQDIYLGFVHLKDLEQKLGQQIELERERNGSFRNLEDFLRRIPAGIEQITLLIRIGAFRFTGKTKKALLWQADSLLIHKKVLVGEQWLFDDLDQQIHLPALHHQPHEDAFDEIELLGFPLCDPFDLINFNTSGSCFADDLLSRVGKVVRMVGYLITLKEVRTIKKERMHFGTFMDDRGKLFDTIHFPPSARKYPFLGKGFYLLKGKVVTDFGVPSLEVDYMEKLPMIKDPRYF